MFIICRSTLRAFIFVVIFLNTFSTHILNAHQQFNPEKVKIIIWDAGSTLTQVSHLAIARELGMKHVVSMFWNLGKPTTMRQLMFEVLEQYQGKQQAAPENGLYTCDDNNIPLPYFMSDTWLCSHITNSEILSAIDTAIAQWKPIEERSAKQKLLLKNTLRIALCARILGKHTICPSKALKMVKRLKAKGYPQYILSNFEKEAFEITFTNEKNEELFALIPRDNIVISGDCKMIKPHPCMYEFFLAKYGLNAEDCLLIDDRPENVIAARNCGMQALRIKDANYKKLKKKIRVLWE